MSRIRYWLSSKSTLGVTLILSGALLIVIVVAVVGFFFIQDATRWGKFPPGSKVCGVDVSGLGKAAAALKCQEQLKGISPQAAVDQNSNVRVRIKLRPTGGGTIEVKNVDLTLYGTMR